MRYGGPRLQTEPHWFFFFLKASTHELDTKETKARSDVDQRYNVPAERSPQTRATISNSSSKAKTVSDKCNCTDLYPSRKRSKKQNCCNYSSTTLFHPSRKWPVLKRRDMFCTQSFVSVTCRTRTWHDECSS